MKMKKNIKRSILGLSIILAVFLAMPMLAFAAPGDEGNLKVEYRFAEGESPDVAETMTQFGINYRLIGQSEPVLEDTLPTTRDYTYRIDGMLSEKDLEEVAKIPGLVLDPVDVKLTKKIDFEDTIKGLSNNDVDSLVASSQYKARVNSMKTNSTAVIIEGPELVGVTFNVTKVDPDFPTFPEEYSADIIVRGVEEYWDVGYYIANLTYTTSDVESEISIYVIVAEYEPVDVPIIDDIIVEDFDDGIVTPIESGFLAGLSETDMVLMDNQTGNPLVDIVNGNVPLGNANVTAGVSLVSALISIAAIIFLVVHLIVLISNRKRKDDLSEYGVDEEQVTIERRRKSAFVALICIASALVPVIWLSLDNVSYPYVWVNAWTGVIAFCLIVDIVLISIYKAKFKAIDLEDDVDYVSANA